MTIDEAAQAEVIESHIVERDRTHLNEQENALLRELLRPGASIEAVIPDNAEPADLWRTLGACVRGANLLEARLCRLKPIIGRILVIFENKPSLYKTLGFETYSDFMNKGVYDTLGLHRTNAYQAKLVARDWPQIGPDRYAGKLGPKKMDVLNKAGIKGSNSNAEQWLQTAESMKVSDLKAYVEQRGFLSVGEADGAKIEIQTNRAIYARWKEFCGDGRIQSVVGSKSQDKILEALMQECGQEWLDRAEEARAAKFRTNGKEAIV